MKNIKVKVLAAVLFLAGFSIFFYKYQFMGFPLNPEEEVYVWNIEARMNVSVSPGPTIVRLFLPSDPPNYTVIDEDFVSAGYGLAVESEGQNRYALWSVRKHEGRDMLYYRIRLFNSPGKNTPRVKPNITYVDAPDYIEPERTAIRTLLSNVRETSADIPTFTRQLIKTFNNNSNENIDILRRDINNEVELAEKIQYILAGAHIPSRIIYLLKLDDGVRYANLVPFLEVNNGTQWLAFNPVTGDTGIPGNMLLWKTGSESVSSMEGGRILDKNFAVSTGYRNMLELSQQNPRMKESSFIKYSVLSLPINIQNLYRVLLLLPIGILVIVLMRNVVGVETFGTFMPILIAFAFRETNLMLGIVLFTVIVGLGLALRFALEKLKLLLVPRLSAVLIMVIILMLIISIVTHQMGMERPLSVALFPMVIIAMTIERMSIVWEEAGARNAMIQGAGSMLVAILGYIVMQNETLGHLIFIFPELILVILGMVVLLGRYSGYRLLEFWRFRRMAGY